MPSSYVIGEHFELFIKDQIQQGRYASASEVIRDGLRALEDREKLRTAKLEALRAEIQQGINSGPGMSLEQVSAELEARYINWAQHGAPADAGMIALSRELERRMMLKQRELELKNERMQILERLKLLEEEELRLLERRRLALNRAQTYRFKKQVPFQRNVPEGLEEATLAGDVDLDPAIDERSRRPA